LHHGRQPRESFDGKLAGILDNPSADPFPARRDRMHFLQQDVAFAGCRQLGEFKKFGRRPFGLRRSRAEMKRWSPGFSRKLAGQTA
jgi:hypothetical protein